MLGKAFDFDELSFFFILLCNICSEPVGARLGEVLAGRNRPKLRVEYAARLLQAGALPSSHLSSSASGKMNIHSSFPKL